MLGGLFDLSSKKDELSSLEKEMESVDFWSDKTRANEVISRVNELKSDVDLVIELENSISNNLEILSSISLSDDEILEVIYDEYKEDLLKLSEIELKTFLSGEYDKNNCIMEIHSGAGGTEACDWANMLYRMYTRYLSKNGYKVEIDFSVTSDTNYYNGFVFKGFIDGIADGVLSGGRYDTLLHKMGKTSGAIGFAVYLDMLESEDK